MKRNPGKRFSAVSRYDRSRHPQRKEYRLMSVEEAKALRPGMRVSAMGQDGRVAEVTVNGKPKTWKTRPGDVDIPWKFGLYEYGTARFRNGVSDGFLVIEMPKRTASGQIDPETEEDEIRRMAEDDRVIRGNPDVDESGQAGGVHVDIYQTNPQIRPPAHIPRHVLEWLHRQPHGSVMSTKTFDDIKQGALLRYGNLKTAQDVAGRAYWNAVLNKYKLAHRRNPEYLENKGRRDIETRARSLGIFVDTYSPGDGATRYRFMTVDQDYFGVDSSNTIYTALGAKEAEIFLAGYGACKFHVGRVQENPPRQATEVYRNIIEIKAEKPDGKKYVHKFGRGSSIFGLEDGSLIVKSRRGKRLWKNFPKGRK